MAPSLPICMEMPCLLTTKVFLVWPGTQHDNVTKCEGWVLSRDRGCVGLWSCRGQPHVQ